MGCRVRGCNWATNCGRSGFVVVDLDGRVGVEAWRERIRDHPPPRTLVSRTGSGRGLHLYFRDADGHARSTTAKLGPGIDTKAQGGMVLVPPSVHPSGGRYQWLNWPAPIADAPDWLLKATQHVAVSYDSPPPELPTVATATAWGRACLNGVLRRLAATEKGQRHDITHWAAVRAGQLYARGHLPASGLDEVLAVALRLRPDEPAATSRDVRDGWRFGTTHLDPRDPQPPLHRGE